MKLNCIKVEGKMLYTSGKTDDIEEFLEIIRKLRIEVAELNKIGFRLIKEPWTGISLLGIVMGGSAASVGYQPNCSIIDPTERFIDALRVVENETQGTIETFGNVCFRCEKLGAIIMVKEINS